jgi:hypothetical protein
MSILITFQSISESHLAILKTCCEGNQLQAVTGGPGTARNGLVSPKWMGVNVWVPHLVYNILQHDLGVPLFSETSIWLEVSISTWFIMV